MTRSASIRVTTLLGSIVAMFGCGGRDAPQRESEVPVGGSMRGSMLVPGTDSIILDRVARIGELDGAPEYAFGEVIAIAARSDSTFFVCDYNDTSIRHYDARGTFLAPVGRKGQGPAEYGDCRFLSIVGDSVLWVGDAPNGRFAGFHLAGGDAGVVLGGDFSNGQFVDEAGRFWWLRADPDYQVGMDRQRYVVTDRALKELAVVRVPPRLFGAKHPRAFAIGTFEGSYINVANDTVWSVAPDGALLAAYPAFYRVRRTGGPQPSLEFTREAAAVPYGPAERAEWEQWREWLTANRDSRIDFDPMPAMKPFIRGVRGDDLDRIWVQVHVRGEKRQVPPRPAGNRTPLLSWRERNTYDLFDATGVYVGRLALPYLTRLLTSRGDRIWLVEEGESGEQLIGIYDLKPARR